MTTINTFSYPIVIVTKSKNVIEQYKYFTPVVILYAFGNSLLDPVNSRP